MTQSEHDRPHNAEVEVSVEWFDGDEARWHLMGVASLGGDDLLGLAAKAGAVAYATATEGGMPARVCVTGLDDGEGAVIYRAR